jgi:heavy metal sensor kinase
MVAMAERRVDPHRPGLTTAWRALSLRARLSIGYAATLAALLTIYAGLVFLVVFQLFNAEVDRRLDQEVEIAERSLFVDPSGNLVWRPPAVGAVGFGALANMLWVDVHRADGSLLHRQLGGYARGGPVEPLALDPSRSGFFSASLPNGTSLRVLQGKVQVAAGQSAVIRAALAEDQIRHDLSIFLLVLGGGLPVSVAIAGLTGYWLARRALAPIDRMTAEARSITAEHLDARLPVVNEHDELGRLAIAFNEIFNRLEQSFSQLRRFTADASHELRTPLTVIRSVGEVGLRQPRSGAEYRDIIGTMLEEVDRLTLLTTMLLELTRAEGGRVELKPEQLDLADLARDAASMLTVLAEEKQVGVLFEFANATLPVVGDATTLRQALVNLLHNAVKYSPVGGSVLLTGRIDAAFVEIGVEDLGPGVAPEHRDRIFDRFYRADEARSRAAGGFGLGLAIAKWAVEANGGQIALMPSKELGATFRIRLPLAASGVHRTRSAA